MPFSVYIHVPFCMRRCGYCDFNTYTALDLGEGASRATFAQVALRDMQLHRRWQEEQGITVGPVDTVFFGGGTPTLLPVDDLIALLSGIRSIWGLQPDAEVTTEANPDTIDADGLARLADGGFTRVSFGMQSAVPHVLHTLDRTHTPANVEACVRGARAAGLRHSVDLIYGTPGESLDDWRTSVQAALDLGVEHISAYALAIEPTTKMGRLIRQGKLPQPDDDDEANKYEIVDSMLEQAGLSWYEVSNWAVPGQESRHNLNYWRNTDWAGIGPGAHGHYRWTDMHGEVHDWRGSEVLHPRPWAVQVAQGKLPLASQEWLDSYAHAEEVAMLGLRIREGLSVQDVEEAAGCVLPQHVITQLVQDDLVTVQVTDTPIRPEVLALHQAQGRQMALSQTTYGAVAVSSMPHVFAPADSSVAQQGYDIRLVPTRKGRLLNDTVIDQVCQAVGLW